MRMSREGVLREVRRAIADCTRQRVEDVTPSSTLEELGVDSLDMVEIGLSLRSQFSAHAVRDVDLEPWFAASGSQEGVTVDHVAQEVLRHLPELSAS